MENKNKDDTKTFSESLLTLENRKLLKLTGVEKIFETNENKLQLKVAGSNLFIFGLSLSVEKLDVNSGILEISGEINELKYSEQNLSKKNFIKKIFKL